MKKGRTQSFLAHINRPYATYDIQNEFNTNASNILTSIYLVKLICI